MRLIVALTALLFALFRRRRPNPARRGRRPRSRTITVIWVEAECLPWSDDAPPVVRVPRD